MNNNAGPQNPGIKPDTVLIDHEVICSACGRFGEALCAPLKHDGHTLRLCSVCLGHLLLGLRNDLAHVGLQSLVSAEVDRLWETFKTQVEKKRDAMRTEEQRAASNQSRYTQTEDTQSSDPFRIDDLINEFIKNSGWSPDFSRTYTQTRNEAEKNEAAKKYSQDKLTRDQYQKIRDLWAAFDHDGTYKPPGPKSP